MAKAPAVPPSAASGSSFDPLDLRKCLGAFVTGVTVITTLDTDGKPVGLTANSFNSVSLDPPLIVWSLRLNATSFSVFSPAKRFAVHILAEDQVEISNRFAKSGADRFSEIPFTAGLDGVPLIDGCAAHLECRTEATHPGGDHLIFIGRVERIGNSGKRPLAFGAGRYMIVHPHHSTLFGSDIDSSNVATLNAVHLARLSLEELNRQTDKTVGLGVWANYGPTLIWWLEAKKPLDVRLRSGMVVPLLGSATGKVFAAFSQPDLVEPFLQAELAAAIKDGASTGFTSRQDVETHLAEVRDKRLGAIRSAIMRDVNERGVSAFSAPVFDKNGAIVLALTMMGDAESFDEGNPAIERLQEAASALSARLGYLAEAQHSGSVHQKIDHRGLHHLPG